MKARLIDFLACPDCQSELTLVPGRVEEGEILDGTIHCARCVRDFPITGGVPRLLPLDMADLAREVAEGFGWQWNKFDELRPEYTQQFLDWVRPLGPSDFAGKRVLEGGCGKGRHSAVVAGFGATDVFAVDLGSAVDAAFRNTRHLPAVHVIQGDITRLPLKRCADVAFSVGVLHHIPDPVAGFRSLADHVVPGGRIAIWVYGREGNEWIVNLVDPVRTHITSKMPRPWLYNASRPLGLLVTAAAKGIYKPLSRLAPALHARMFYKDYLTYIADLSERDIHNIVFDQLVTPVAYDLPRAEVASWFDDPRFGHSTIEHHNSNSWRANAFIERQAQ